MEHVPDWVLVWMSPSIPVIDCFVWTAVYASSPRFREYSRSSYTNVSLSVAVVAIWIGVWVAVVIGGSREDLIFYNGFTLGVNLFLILGFREMVKEWYDEKDRRG